MHMQNQEQTIKEKQTELNSLRELLVKLQDQTSSLSQKIKETDENISSNIQMLS